MSRTLVDDALDRLRFLIDSSPRNVGWLRKLGLPEIQSAVYHELPWVGLSGGRRGASSATRWSRMAPLIERLDVRSAVDIGGNSGWFAFKLAELGIPCVVVDRDPRMLRVGLYVRKRSGLRQATFMALDLTPDALGMVPPSDCCVVLSVWHHFVRDYGRETADAMLAQLWARTGSVLFFDSGEDEMPTSWGMPTFAPDAETWLARHLTSICTGGQVIHLGRHDALGPDDEPCERNLFAVVRGALPAA